MGVFAGVSAKIAVRRVVFCGELVVFGVVMLVS
jgi:hypothetical protein